MNKTRSSLQAIRTPTASTCARRGRARQIANRWALTDTAAGAALAAGEHLVEDTLAVQVARLAGLGLDIFIDDLVDVFR